MKKQRSPFRRVESPGRALVSAFRHVVVKPDETPRAGQAIYRSARWARLSAKFRREHPVCQYCHAAPSVLVDHRIEIADMANPAVQAYDRSNLVACCSSCHGKKTRAVRQSHGWAGVQQAIEQQLAAAEAKAKRTSKD